MSLRRIIIGFLKREHFDFDNPNLDLYTFHPQLRACYALNGIFFHNRKSLLRFILPGFNIIMTIMGLFFEFMFMYHGIVDKEYAFATESANYLIILGTVPFVYQSILGNPEKIFALLEHINKDFVCICSLEDKYRKHFLSGQLLIWHLFLGWFSLCGVVGVFFVFNCFFILLYQNTLGTYDEHTLRPVIFPVWLPNDDPFRTPIYEFFVIYEIYLIVLVISTFVLYVYTLFHYLLHCCYMIDMIKMDIDTLFDGIDEEVAKLPKEDPIRVQAQRTLRKRLKRIVDWHTGTLSTVDTVSSVCGPPISYQIMVSSILICVVVYQVAAQLEEGKLSFRFTLLTAACSVQLFIPCYLGSLLMDKAISIGDACWNSAWYESSLGSLIKQDIMIIIQRTQVPVNIRFVCLPMLSLETYSSIMSTAYSYLNMLRQSTKN